jgi:ribosomal protein L44E
METYCVKCKKHTDTKEDSIRVDQTKNGKRLTKGTCGFCNKTKAQFVKKKD